jgi:hypothetical protein
MEKVVYLLGAGFSAPLGLPVMSNFLTKSKDIFLGNPTEYDYFKNIYDTIDKMGKSTIYYKTDLLNIEEILSILEMSKYLKQTDNAIEFKKFISAVINKSTPDIHPTNKLFSNWYHRLFDGDDLLDRYGCFLANLINLELRGSKDSISAWCMENDLLSYSVVTLNYDMILEELWRSIKRLTKGTISSGRPMKEMAIAKLHGSADKPDSIVSPTWNKMIDNLPLNDWVRAHAWLKDASHIRIIGYSLPITDSYIKYLLKSSILDTFNLKSIDVICLDGDGAVKVRYDNFVTFGLSYRFRNASTQQYLEFIYKDHMEIFQKEVKPPNNVAFYQYLENSHNKFMESGRF